VDNQGQQLFSDLQAFNSFSPFLPKQKVPFCEKAPFKPLY